MKVTIDADEHGTALRVTVLMSSVVTQELIIEPGMGATIHLRKGQVIHVENV